MNRRSFFKLAIGAPAVISLAKLLPAKPIEMRNEYEHIWFGLGGPPLMTNAKIVNLTPSNLRLTDCVVELEYHDGERRRYFYRPGTGEAILFEDV